jgi:hypothetical protein
VIGTVLQDLVALALKVYNIDETGVMLSMLDLIKVLFGKDDKRKYTMAEVRISSVRL